MKIQDLRVGNYVWLHKDSGKKIYQIDSGYDLYKLDESDCADISEIKLTEEILLNNRFNKEVRYGTSYVYFVEKGQHKPIIEVCIYLNDKGEFETGDDLPMLSVNQLQNYSYYKTGEELTLIL